MEIPEFKNIKERNKFLIENKELLIAQKKATLKRADGVGLYPVYSTEKEDKTIKANEPIENAPEVLNTKLVINTTNLMDSHKDVHIPGLWNKSLDENKNIMHLQEHQMAFNKIIADGNDLEAYVKTFNWRDIGQSYKGTTEALIFESKVRKDRNSFMHSEYSQGRVKNHSVGMHYVKLALAMNDENYGAEFEAWEKYINFVSNKEMAEGIGYFWAVKEAKVIEGSAVPLGSNQATPTLENNLKFEPSNDTQKTNEPHQKHSTTKKRRLI